MTSPAVSIFKVVRQISVEGQIAIGITFFIVTNRTGRDT
jgi:hypothetical protein